MFSTDVRACMENDNAVVYGIIRYITGLESRDSIFVYVFSACPYHNIICVATRLPKQMYYSVSLSTLENYPMSG